MKRRLPRCRPVELFAVLCLLTAGTTAPAQQPVVEEIIVTATKREQSLQDVPVSIEAFGSMTLDRARVQDIRDLQQISPSLFVSSSQAETAGTTARIRGVGTTGDNLGLESSVAVFVDGVYRNRNNVALTDLGELERIEILRGPQGTLFGKNASAGLIQIITKSPDVEEFGGYAEGSIGDYDYYRLAAGVTGPIVEGRSGYSLDASWQQRDGFIDEVFSGEEYNDRDRYLLRGQLTSQIGDALDLRLIADYSSREETCCAAVTDIAGQTAAAIGAVGGTLIVPPDPFEREFTANTNRGYDQDVDEWGLSLEANWDIGPGTLTSITAYRDWDSERTQDADFTNADIIHRSTTPTLRDPSSIPNKYENEFETFTQEFRYAGTSGDVDWLFGFYYVDEDLTFRDAVRVGTDYENYSNALLFGLTGDPTRNLSFYTGIPAGSVFIDGDGAQQDNWNQTTESWALFTHNTWRATERLDVTLGLRYTDEEKDLEGSLTAINPACFSVLGQIQGGTFPIPPDPNDPEFTTVLGLTCLPLLNPAVDGQYVDSRSDEEVTGTFNVAYRLTDDWLSWISYGRGYKAGGYNLDRGGLLFNPLAGVFPAADQLEFDAETVDSFELGFKGTLWDERVQLNIVGFISQFDDFQLNTFNGTNFLVTNVEEVESKGIETDFSWFATEGLTLQGGASYTDARYDDSVDDPTLAGRRITNAPYWLITATADYERPIGDLLGFVNVNYRFASDFNTGSDLKPEKKQSSFRRLEWQPGHRRRRRSLAGGTLGAQYFRPGFSAGRQSTLRSRPAPSRHSSATRGPTG